MAYKATQTGQFVLSDDSSAEAVSAFDFAKKIIPVTGMKKYVRNSRTLRASDGAIALPLGGIVDLKGLVILVSGPGSIAFKHDGNITGMTVTQELLLFGSIASPIISTTSVEDLMVDYMFFGD